MEVEERNGGKDGEVGRKGGVREGRRKGESLGEWRLIVVGTWRCMLSEHQLCRRLN